MSTRRALPLTLALLFVAACSSSDGSSGSADAGVTFDTGDDAGGDGFGDAADVEPGCGDGAVDDGEACDDGNLADGDGCTAECEVLEGWRCAGSPSTCEERPESRCDGVDCSALDDGCTVGVCNAESGACEPGAAPDGTSCDDGNLCSSGDVCTQGACVGSPISCDDTGLSCLAAPTCNPETGACEGTPLPDGSACDDGDRCTNGDVCDAGACSGGALDCSSFDGACVAGTCDPTVGCLAVPIEDGTACDDGLACTAGDACDAGACSGTPVDCSDVGDGACTIGVCDPADGTCDVVDAEDGTSCEDGDVCTIDSTCGDGVCGDGALAPVGTPCAGDGAGACERFACTPGGACTLGPVRDGDACDDDDGDACTEGACVDGVCNADPVDCTDLGGATCADPVGLCDRATGCYAGDCGDLNNDCMSFACGDGFFGPTCEGTAVDDDPVCDDEDADTELDACFRGGCIGCAPDAFEPADDIPAEASPLALATDRSLCRGDVDLYFDDAPRAPIRVFGIVAPTPCYGRAELHVSSAGVPGDVVATPTVDCPVALQRDGAARADLSVRSAAGAAPLPSYGLDAITIDAAEPAADTGTPLVVGDAEAVFGRLDDDEDADTFTFSVDALEIAVFETTGPLLDTCRVDTVVSLSGSGGRIDTDDDGGLLGCSRIVAPLPPGSYDVEISAFDGGGANASPYLLTRARAPLDATFENEGNDDRGSATAMSGIAAGWLGAADADWYRFTVSTAGTLLAYVDNGVDGCPAEMVDTRLRLTDGSGASIGEEDDVDGLCPVVSVEVTPGDYFARVDSSTGDRGGYLLHTVVTP